MRQQQVACSVKIARFSLAPLQRHPAPPPACGSGGSRCLAAHAQASRMARRAQSERFLAPHTLDASLLLALCKGLRLLFTGMPAALTDQHAHVFGSLRIVAVGVNKVLQEELHRACAPAAILNARKAGAVSSVSWGGLRAACMHMQQAACLCRRHSWQAAP